MYQVQIINLIREFHQSTQNQYQLKKLMNNQEYRNQCFAVERLNTNNKVKLIISQVEAFEDLLSCEFQVDLIPKDHSKNNESNQKWALVAFAFVGLLFIGGSITTIEHIKHNRQVIHENQAD